VRPALKAGLLPVWRDRETVQIGIDPRRAVALTGIGQAALILGLLDGSRDRTQVLAAAQEQGIPVAVTERVLTLLAAGGVLDDFPAAALAALPQHQRQRLATELAAAALARGHSDAGATALARRDDGRVHIYGPGRVAAALADILAASGVRRVTVSATVRVPAVAAPAPARRPAGPSPRPRSSPVPRRAGGRREPRPERREPGPQLRDPRPERPEPRRERPEPRPGRSVPQPERREPQPERPEPRPEQPEPRPEQPEPRPERPQPRPERREPQPERPRPRPERRESRSERPVPASRPDLAVLVGFHDRDLASRLVRLGVAHLAVTAQEAIGVVGPLVRPGQTACLRCLDLTRSALDPAWPLILAQITGRAPQPAACDAALAAAVAAQAAAQVLAFLDRDLTALAAENGTLELVQPGWQWRRRTWPPQPGCSCGAG
jgi:hypothetical protein